MMLAAYFLGFVFYSFLGWIWETTYCSIKAKHFINRGFLNGPIIPIYGCGAVLIMLAVNAFGTLALPTPAVTFNLINILVVFFGGMLLATILEYIVAVILESFFHIKLWDYSKYRFNFQGRVCLKSSLFFGLLSVLFIMVIEPLTTHATTQIPDMVINIAAGVIGIILAVDIIIAVSSLLKLNEQLRAAEEIINAKVGTTLVEAAKIRDTFHERIEERMDENLLISQLHYQIGRMARAYPGSVSLKHTEIQIICILYIRGRRTMSVNTNNIISIILLAVIILCLFTGTVSARYAAAAGENAGINLSDTVYRGENNLDFSAFSSGGYTVDYLQHVTDGDQIALINQIASVGQTQAPGTYGAWNNSIGRLRYTVCTIAELNLGKIAVTPYATTVTDSNPDSISKAAQVIFYISGSNLHPDQLNGNWNGFTITHASR